MKKNRVLYALIVLIWIFGISCSSKSKEVETSEMSIISEPSNAVSEEQSSNKSTSAGSVSNDTEPLNLENGSDISVTEPQKQYIIRSAEIKMMVEDVMKSTTNIEKIIEKYNGFVSDSKLETLSNSFSNQLTLRVPVVNFDKVINEITPLAEYIDHRNVVSEDVTKDYVDTEVRLKNKKEVEKRFIEVLRNQAKNVRDIMEVERQLNEIRSEIESAESYLNSLKNKVSLSTITVEIYQTVNYQKPPRVYTKSIFSEMGDALKNGWNAIVSVFIILLNLWPILFIILIALTLVYFLKWRKRK